MMLPNIRKGFTLIELLVVISIIGVIAGFLLVSLGGVQKAARDSQRKAQIAQYQQALETVANAQGGVYPVTTASITTSFCNAYLGSSISGCPQDPRNADDGTFVYSYSSDGARYVVWAKLENSTDYWVTCSDGQKGYAAQTTSISGGTCPQVSQLASVGTGGGSSVSTTAPTSAPTAAPTIAPTTAPTVAPTAAPTIAPTIAPTTAPTTAPTDAPTTSIVQLTTYNGNSFYRVPVNGLMTDANVKSACDSAGYTVPCNDAPNGQYSDNLCKDVGFRDGGAPMSTLSGILGCSSVPGCVYFQPGTFQYMGEKWRGACGSGPDTWCTRGNSTNSTGNYDALCVSR